MLSTLRQQLIKSLWERYCSITPQMEQVIKTLSKNNIHSLPLDHFAIIDLPGSHSGISHLTQIFSTLGYVMRGKDYLADKQNDFLWMAEENCQEKLAHHALPQIVVADFRLDELPIEIKKIILKYSEATSSSPIEKIQKYLNENKIEELINLLQQYFNGRDWPLPTINEYYTVKEFNELLSWVLIYGRQPNHFTLSIHLMDEFKSLEAFHQFLFNETELKLNSDGGIIKGGPQVGLAQSSTQGTTEILTLSDGEIILPTRFIEFVWRYPVKTSLQQPRLWKDFFTDFIGTQANHVIESVYLN